MHGLCGARMCGVARFCGDGGLWGVAVPGHGCEAVWGGGVAAEFCGARLVQDMAVRRCGTRL